MKTIAGLLAFGALASLASAIPAPHKARNLEARTTNWYDNLFAHYTVTVTETATKTYCPPVLTPPPTPIALPGKVFNLGGANPPVTITQDHQTVTSPAIPGPTTTL